MRTGENPHEIFGENGSPDHQSLELDPIHPLIVTQKNSSCHVSSRNSMEFHHPSCKNHTKNMLSFLYWKSCDLSSRKSLFSESWSLVFFKNRPFQTFFWGPVSIISVGHVKRHLFHPNGCQTFKTINFSRSVGHHPNHWLGFCLSLWPGFGVWDT